MKTIKEVMKLNCSMFYINQNLTKSDIKNIDGKSQLNPS